MRKKESSHWLDRFFAGKHSDLRDTTFDTELLSCLTEPFSSLTQGTYTYCKEVKPEIPAFLDVKVPSILA